MDEEEDRPFRCKTCGKRFRRRQNLQTHTLSHTHFQQYKCSICEKKFVYRHDFRVHLNKHNGIRPHKCHLCEKTFLRASELKSHLNSTIHAGNKPWKCVHCKKRFSQHAHLQAHLRSHTGEKPHKCQVCGKKFTQSSHLNSHMLFHTGEKPHQCSVCRKRYRLKTTLNCHTRTHTGERPYKCPHPHCPRAFTQHTPLAEHIQKAHGNQTFSCGGCEKTYSTRQQLMRHEKSHLTPEFATATERKRHERTSKKHNKRVVKKEKLKGKLKSTLEDERGKDFGREERHLSQPPIKQQGNKLSKEDRLQENITVTAEKEGEEMRVDNGSNSHSSATPVRASTPDEQEMEDDPAVASALTSSDMEIREDINVEQDRINRESTKKAPFQCPKCEKSFHLKTQLNGHVWIHRKSTKRGKTHFTKRKQQKQQPQKKTDLLDSSNSLDSDDSTPPPFLKPPLNLNSISGSADHLITTERMPRLQKQPTISEVPLVVSPQQYLYQKAFDKSTARLAREKVERQRMATLLPFRCPQCSYAADCTISVQLHVQLVHFGVECHKCTQCWKSFPSRQRLREHQLSKHDNNDNADVAAKVKETKRSGVDVRMNGYQSTE